MPEASLKTYSSLASLARATDIADACALFWQEPWVVVRTDREFQVHPSWLRPRGKVVHVTEFRSV